MSANRLHPLSAVTTAVQRGFVVGSFMFFLVSILSGVVSVVDVSWAFVLSPLGFLVGAGYALAYYYRFEYELTDDTFDIASGVVSRRDREIPFGRVQNVDVRQGIVSRIVGIAVVTIETAGGGSTEATLNFVSASEADRLQREIRRRTAARDRPRQPERTGEATMADETPTGSDRATSVDEEHDRSDDRSDRSSQREMPAERSSVRPHQLFALEMRELLLYSFASFRPAAVAALGFLTLFGMDFVVEYLLTVTDAVARGTETDLGTTSRPAIFGLVSAAHAVVVTYAMSIAYTFVAYYGFRLGRAGDDLVYERGLLQRYSGSIPLEKVQSVTVTDNPVQRLIGYAGLWVETAGYGPDSDSGSQSAVPLANRSRAYAFAERLSGVERPVFDRPTTIARRRYAVRYGLLVTVFVLVVYGLFRVTTFDTWYVTLVLYLAVPPAAHLRWKHLGYYVGEDNLIVREGFWSRRTTVIPYYRIQTISTRRSVFQRRLGLASVVVDTASSQTFTRSNPTIYDVELPIGRTVNETARDRLQAALAARDENESLLGDSL